MPQMWPSESGGKNETVPNARGKSSLETVKRGEWVGRSCVLVRFSLHASIVQCKRRKQLSPTIRWSPCRRARRSLISSTTVFWSMYSCGGPTALEANPPSISSRNSNDMAEAESTRINFLARGGDGAQASIPNEIIPESLRLVVLLSTRPSSAASPGSGKINRRAWSLP